MADPRAAHRRATSRAGETEAPLRLLTWGTRRFGIAVAATFFLGGGAWAGLAPLSSAAIAPGVVSPESSRKVIQHLEGGIVRRIRVRDGDVVDAGDVLVELEDVSAGAEVGKLASRLRALAAQEARLRAEKAGAPSIDFNHPSLADRTDPGVKDVIETENDNLRSRRQTDAREREILRRKVARLREQIAGLKEQLARAKEQDSYFKREIDAVQPLVEKGLARLPRLLTLQRGRANVQGEQGKFRAAIAEAHVQIGQTEVEILGVESRRREEIAAELARVQTARAEVEQEITNSRDRLSRTQITAPIRGTVIDLRIKTTGGVIRPGQPLMDIVPLADNLVIEARISPKDVDDVVPGQKAHVIFPSVSTRNLLKIEGSLTRVSADALENERTGERYFSAEVQVDRAYLAKRAPGVELQAGLPAEVYIQTGERTVLQYLMSPMTQTIMRSMSEK